MSDKINGRTPEEIKLGLKCDGTGDCTNTICPYFPEKDCLHSRHFDAFALIQQLEIERDAAQKERNALMADLQAVCGGKFRDNCIVCGNYRPDEQKEKRCILNGWICSWEWRGIQEDKPT